MSIYTYKSRNSSTAKFQWIQHWDQLDLATIKKEYQPYTVVEMHEMWSDKLIAKYGGAERLKQAIGKAANVYPENTYLARMLELGRPFLSFSDYEDALTEERTWLFSMRIYWEIMSVGERGNYLEHRGLPTNATWEMYEDTLLKGNVVNSINFWRSKQQDPYINGALHNLNNVACPGQSLSPTYQSRQQR